MNRILFHLDEVGEDGRVHLTGSRARHALHVLGVVPGQRIRVGIVDGPRGTGIVERKTGGLLLTCVFEGEPPPRPGTSVLLSLPRPKVMKRLWGSLASMGVRSIILTNANKVDRAYFGTHWLDSRHYEPLLVEGLQQSGDTRLPKVLIRRLLKPLIEDELDALVPEGGRFLLTPGAETSVWPGVPGEEHALAAIGPEGGWTPFETALLEDHGFIPVSLGWRTLRTETACIAALAVLQSRMESFT
jgi:RsmE family RNA methyltransferase